MKVQKLGHCCLLIESGNTRLLTDPGFFTESKVNSLTNLNFILITHEHADHLHIESLKVLLRNNAEAKIITNSSVGKILDENGIQYSIFDLDTNLVEINLKTFDSPHANVYPTIPNVENTALIFDNRLLYPGDSWFYPDSKVETLALPISAPWLKLSDAIDYAKKIKPKSSFPVHDAIMANPAMFHGLVENLLKQNGIEFLSLEDGEFHEI